MQKSSITDLPKKANQKDVFGIAPFEQGLIQFIQNSNTPITIALQGEWGSGKTSLMNSLKKISAMAIKPRFMTSGSILGNIL